MSNDTNSEDLSESDIAYYDKMFSKLSKKSKKRKRKKRRNRLQENILAECYSEASDDFFEISPEPEDNNMILSI